MELTQVYHSVAKHEESFNELVSYFDSMITKYLSIENMNLVHHFQDKRDSLKKLREQFLTNEET